MQLTSSASMEINLFQVMWLEVPNFHWSFHGHITRNKLVHIQAEKVDLQRIKKTITKGNKQYHREFMWDLVQTFPGKSFNDTKIS